MKESIYINNFKNKIDVITDYISVLKNNSKFTFSSIHQNNDIIQIVTKNNSCFSPSFIAKYKLSCVIENDLFRTIYLDGNRIMWKSLHN